MKHITVLHNDELNYLYWSPDVSSVIKPRRKRIVSGCRTFAQDKICRKLQLEKLQQIDEMGNEGSTFKNGTKLHVQDTECVSVHLAKYQYNAQHWAVMNTVPASFIKGETFPEHWSDYRIFKNDSTPKKAIHFYGVTM